MSSKSISILLPDGDSTGLKIIGLGNRTIKAVLVPRVKLNEAKSIDQLNQPALYVLCDKEGQQVYIGECENFVHRIKTHDQSKDFWEVAIAFVATDNSLEKGDVKYLEWLAIEAAKNAERMKVVNATIPARNNLHEFKIQTVLEFFEDLKLLISTLGYPVFDKVTLESATEDQIWYCKTRRTNARAIYDDNGFTVLKGSVIDGTHQPSFVKYYPYAVNEREQLFNEKATTQDNGKTYTLEENITFSSANKAGGFVVGANINAWTTWKNKAGKTMDAIIRQ